MNSITTKTLAATAVIASTADALWAKNYFPLQTYDCAQVNAEGFWSIISDPIKEVMAEENNPNQE